MQICIDLQIITFKRNWSVPKKGGWVDLFIYLVVRQIKYFPYPHSVRGEVCKLFVEDH